MLFEILMTVIVVLISIYVFYCKEVERQIKREEDEMFIEMMNKYIENNGVL